jgi:hypothetical protein
MDEIEDAAKAMTAGHYLNLLQKDEMYRKYVTQWVNVHCRFFNESNRPHAIRNCLEHAYKEWLNKSTNNKEINYLVPEK